MSAICAIVPAKRFAAAKARLAPAMPPAAREALARAMLDRVLRALCASPSVREAIVLTDGDEVADFAQARGADVLRDPPGAPLRAVIDAGLREAGRRGDAAAVLMADLPWLDASDVDALVAALAGADVVLAPDHAGLGTNALVVSDPSRFRSCFGHPRSFALHRARARGMIARVHRCEGIARDVDVPADLDQREVLDPANRNLVLRASSA